MELYKQSIQDNKVITCQSVMKLKMEKSSLSLTKYYIMKKYP
jgi:hypothetical protein